MNVHSTKAKYYCFKAICLKCRFIYEIFGITDCFRGRRNPKKCPKCGETSYNVKDLGECDPLPTAIERLPDKSFIKRKNEKKKAVQ